MLQTETVDFSVKPSLVKLKKTYHLHLLIWILLIAYELYTISFAVGILAEPNRLVSHYLINITFFYFTSLYVLPSSLRYGNQWLWRLPIFLTAAFALLILSKGLLDFSFKLLDKDLGRPLHFDAKYIGGAAWRGLYFLALAFFFYYFRTYVKERDTRETLERQNLENRIKEQELQLELTQARQAYLKAQINPHFLFNTLNYIFSLVQKSEPDAAKAVIKLSNMMRFALDAEHAESNPPLSVEITHSRNLIDLWLVPKSETTYLNFNVDNKALDYRFIPLVLLTLLENVFKHGNLSNPSAPGIVNISINADHLIIETMNQINTKINSSGVNLGLNNLNQRLENAYGRNFTFFYNSDKEYFLVKIAVALGALEKTNT